MQHLNNTDTHNPHTERTQFSHNPHTHRNRNTQTKQYAVHRTEHREQTQYTDTERTQNSAHNYRTYSFDLYHEYAYINNSNTIELYTILND